MTVAAEPRLRESVLDELARNCATDWRMYVADCERRNRQHQASSSLLPYVTGYFDFAVYRDKTLAPFREPFFARVYREIARRIQTEIGE